jgi:hypothetical protein
MHIGPKLKNTRRNTHLRFVVAFVISFTIIAIARLFIGPDARLVALKNSTKEPSIKFTGDKATLQHPETDAFFIPTRYNAKYQIQKPSKKKIRPHRDTPIFSELDKIRIFNIFVKYFTESEYWVISSLNLRSGNFPEEAEKSFIKAVDYGFNVDYRLKNWYDCDTQILFKDECDKY